MCDAIPTTTVPRLLMEAIAGPTIMIDVEFLVLRFVYLMLFLEKGQYDIPPLSPSHEAFPFFWLRVKNMSLGS